MKKNRFLLLVTFVVFIFSTVTVNAMEIFVQTIEGENISIEVETSDTIEDIKAKIFNKNNEYLIDKQKLYYNDKNMIDGRTFGDYYSSSLGNIVKMELVDVVNVVLNANGGLFTDKEEYVVEDIYGDGDGRLIIPTREGYVFKGFYTKKDGGLTVDYFAENNVIENGTIFYAHWDKVGIATLDFTKIINVGSFTSLEIDLLQILIDHEILLSDQSDMIFKNSSGKILVKVDEAGNWITAEELTSADNIIYTLSEEDKQLLLNDYEESYVPNIIEVIVAEEKENPQTFDNIENSILMGMLSLIVLVGSAIYLKKIK